MINSESEEQPQVTTPFESATEKNNTIHVFNSIDETRGYNFDEVNDFSVLRTHFDRWPHTHYSSEILCSIQS